MKQSDKELLELMLKVYRNSDIPLERVVDSISQKYNNSNFPFGFYMGILVSLGAFIIHLILK